MSGKLPSAKWACVAAFAAWSVYSLRGIVTLVQLPASTGPTDTSLPNAVQPHQAIDLHFYLSKSEVTNEDFRSISLHKDPLLPSNDRYIPLFGRHEGGLCSNGATTNLVHVLSFRASYSHPYVSSSPPSESGERHPSGVFMTSLTQFLSKRKSKPALDEASILRCSYSSAGGGLAELASLNKAGAIRLNIPEHLEHQRLYITALATKVHRDARRPPRTIHDVYAMPPDSARLTLMLTPPALKRPVRLLLRDPDGRRQLEAMEAFLRDRRGDKNVSMADLATKKWLSVPRHVDVSLVVHHGSLSRAALIARGLRGLVSPAQPSASVQPPPVAKEVYTLPLSINTLSSPRDEFIPLEIEELVRIAEGNYDAAESAATSTMRPAIKYTPKTLKGWLLQHLMVESLNVAEHKYGIPEYDIDSLKAMMGGGNATLIFSTMTISLLHIIFSLLSVSSDFSFWTSNAIGAARGISATAIQLEIVLAVLIALYLWDTGHAFIVLALLAAKILLYVFKLVQIRRFRKQLTSVPEEAEDLDRYERLWMPRLALILGPFVLGVCTYRLVFIPQASWPSWIIESLAVCSYAGGFIAMTPQLFRNYKLQSVDHLPWATLTYQALNAFVDDFFAFIIRMPQIHRFSVFRDDVIFIVYICQYFLYRKRRATEEEKSKAASIAEGKDGGVSQVDKKYK